MKFWDASALVPLLVSEEASELAAATLAPGEAMLVWWASRVECASALARLERQRPGPEIDQALDRLARYARTWVEVEPTDPLRDLAQRLLRVHPLRAADALQLAAARVVSRERPAELPFVCLDQRLADAARREGFPVIGAGPAGGAPA